MGAFSFPLDGCSSSFPSSSADKMSISTSSTSSNSLTPDSAPTWSEREGFGGGEDGGTPCSAGTGVGARDETEDKGEDLEEEGTADLDRVELRGGGGKWVGEGGDRALSDSSFAIAVAVFSSDKPNPVFRINGGTVRLVTAVGRAWLETALRLAGVVGDSGLSWRLERGR